MLDLEKQAAGPEKDEAMFESTLLNARRQIFQGRKMTFCQPAVPIHPGHSREGEVGEVVYGIYKLTQTTLKTPTTAGSLSRHLIKVRAMVT